VIALAVEYAGAGGLAGACGADSGRGAAAVGSETPSAVSIAARVAGSAGKVSVIEPDIFEYHCVTHVSLGLARRDVTYHPLIRSCQPSCALYKMLTSVPFLA
jgi:hypothetical protein